MAQTDVESAVSEAVADMDGAEAKEFLNKMSVMYKIDTMDQMRRERDRLKQFYHKQKDKDKRLRTWVNLMAERLEQSGKATNASYAQQLRVVLTKLNSIDTDSRNDNQKNEEENSDDGGEDITKHPQLLDESAIALACEGLGRSELYAVEHQLHRMKDLHEAEEIERQMRNMTTIIKQLYRRDTRMLKCMEVLGTQLQSSGDHKLWIDTYQIMAQRCGTDEASIAHKEEVAVEKQIELERSQSDLSAGASGGRGLTRKLSRSLSNLSRSISNLSSSNVSGPSTADNDGASTGADRGTRGSQDQTVTEVDTGSGKERRRSSTGHKQRDSKQLEGNTARTPQPQTTDKEDVDGDTEDVYGPRRSSASSVASESGGGGTSGRGRDRQRATEVIMASAKAAAIPDRVGNNHSEDMTASRRESRETRTRSRERPRVGSRSSTGSSTSTRSRDSVNAAHTRTRTRRESQQSIDGGSKDQVRDSERCSRVDSRKSSVPSSDQGSIDDKGNDPRAGGVSGSKSQNRFESSDDATGHVTMDGASEMNTSANVSPTTDSISKGTTVANGESARNVPSNSTMQNETEKSET